MDVPFARKVNRRVRMLAEVPWKAGIKKFLNILSIKPYTMVEYPRLASMYDIMIESERFNDIEGTIVECGTWNGGYALLMNKISEDVGKKRDVWLFDSFKGLPAPQEVDKNKRGFLAKRGAARGAEAVLRTAFQHVDQGRVHVVEGWFEDTFSEVLPKIGKIAYVHLDADLYEPTKFCLEKLWPLLSYGALVIIDDYSYYQGCKKAVDDFLAHNHIRGLVRSADETAYIRKI